MKHASANYRNRSGAWKGKALATLLAVSLAATPMAAFATDGESAAAAAIAETEAAAPSAPEKQPEAAGENETLTTSVTVYYCEMVYYDDPSFNDPTGFRLLGSHTFDGVKVGEEINLWEYAKDIPDFVHFDGWAVNPIASANPEENLVQMNYFRTKSPSSVNYYLVTDGAETPEDAPIDPSMGEVDGESVAFWKMGSYEVESLRLGTEISSDACAVSLEGLTYLGADKAAIAVDAMPSRNEINLFYAADPADQPDNAPAPAPEPPAPSGGKMSQDDIEKMLASMGAPAEEPAPAPVMPPAPKAPEKPIEEDVTYINVMQTLVEEKALRYIKMFGLCDCKRCQADVKALTLSNLVPKYVVLSSTDRIPMLTVYEGRFNSTVVAQLTRSCKIVMDSPRHDR